MTVSSTNAILRAGVATTDITPRLGTPLAGTMTLRPAQKIVQRIHAKALVLEQGAERHAIVTADGLGFDERMVARLARMARQRFGIRTLLCNASHAHSCPDSYNEFCTYTDRKALALRRRHLQDFEAKLNRILAAAVRGLQPVTLSFGKGRASFGINRRRKIKGVWELMPNPRGFHDKTVPVYRFAKADGQPLALLFSYTCHPTTSYGNDLWNAVHGDYPGFAQAEIERKAGATALFLQGPGGDIRPAVIKPGTRPPRFCCGTQKHLKAYGHELAAEVLRVARGRMTPLLPALGGWVETVALPFAPPPTAAQVRATAAAHKAEAHYAFWARATLQRLRAGTLPRSLPTDVILLRLAPDHALAATGHELCSGYGPLFQKEAPGMRLTVLGYTNSLHGYVPTRQLLCEGGYEADWSLYAYGVLPGPFTAAVETRLCAAVRRLVRQANRAGRR